MVLLLPQHPVTHRYGHSFGLNFSKVFATDDDTHTAFQNMFYIHSICLYSERVLIISKLRFILYHISYLG